MQRMVLSVALLALASGWGGADELPPIVNAGEVISAAHFDSVLPSAEHARNRFVASADVLNWRPHMRGLDFAITEQGTASILGPARVHNLAFDRNAGVRGRLGFVSKVGWGLGVTYTGLSTEGRSSVSRPPGIGQLFATSSHPAAVEEADIANAVGVFDYDVFDLEAQYPIHDSRYLGVNFFGGFRWASIEQNLRTVYDGRDYVNGVIQDDLSVDAYGIRVGAETQWRMAGGFSLFAKGALGAMYAQVDAAKLESNLDGAETLLDAHDSYTQPSTNIETAGGLTWSSQRVQVSAGYELSIWEGALDRFRFIDDIEEGSFSPVSNSLLLEGFFFRVATVW